MELSDRFAQVRTQFQDAGLSEEQMHEHPISQLRDWFQQAQDIGLHEPEAMIISTVDASGIPTSRYVLLRKYNNDGLFFFTNYTSKKAQDLLHKPNAPIAICFPWNDISRQVRIVGTVEKTSGEISDAYFASRPRESQIGAWASHQSEVIVDRSVLDHAVEQIRIEKEFEHEISRPPFWGGFCITPLHWEFWQARPSRLHDRFRYTQREGQNNLWNRERLSP